MVTSFLTRWSKRKLDETKNKSDDKTASDASHMDDINAQTTADAHADIVSEHLRSDEAQYTVSEDIATQTTETPEATSVDATISPQDTDTTEEPSIATLLVSEASASVKKAALRKLFLSEEFNIRDGLDDYDDDYSQLKSLSEGVAETLRDWVKEKTEEEPEKTLDKETDTDTDTELTTLEHDSAASDDITNECVAKQHIEQEPNDSEQNEALDIKTVSGVLGDDAAKGTISENGLSPESEQENTSKKLI